MNNIRLNIVLVLSILFIGLQSCSEDQDIGSDIIAAEDFRAQGNNQDGQERDNIGPNRRGDNNGQNDSENRQDLINLLLIFQSFPYS